MEDLDMTIEEYVQYENEKALRNDKVYNWEIATYGFSSEPMVSPQHIDEINFKNEKSLSKYDDEKYNVISYSDLFPFNIISVNESKLETDNDDDKIDVKQSLEDISIEPSNNVITLRWLLEEIHVTWDHLEKKRTRLRLYNKSLGRIRIQCVDTAPRFLAMTSDHISDGVRKFKTTSDRNRLKRIPRRFGEAAASKNL
ncbi:hypothetical protein Tco_0936513 [Tanacetum coccineum]